VFFEPFGKVEGFERIFGEQFEGIVLIAER
jgi:hypothetical protein